MKTLIAGLVLASALALPAFAQSYDPDLGTGNIAPQIEAPAPRSGAQDAYAQVRHRAPGARHLDPRGGARVPAPHTAYGAVTPFGSPAVDHNGKNLAAAREATIRECSTLAAPYKTTTWGHMEIHTYRTCMARHGLAE